MKTENKYYIPSIEEFHVGFECEIKNSSDEKNFDWEHFEIIGVDDAKISGSIMDWSFYDSNRAIYEESIRVKYLDQSDIESLGFDLKDVLNKEDKVTGEKKEWQLLFSYAKALDIPGRFRLYFYPNAYGFNVAVRHPLSDGPVIFKGKLKNKSELKRLLKQLGIKEDE